MNTQKERYDADTRELRKDRQLAEDIVDLIFSNLGRVGPMKAVDRVEEMLSERLPDRDPDANEKEES